jgi:mannose/fructose-specific phosphotransferase system component IIA
MIGGLIVTHGRLAIELLNAAETIVGEIHHIAAVSLGWHDDMDTATTMIQKALERVRSPEGVLILTDMFGGTPTNIADGQSLASVARLVRENGQSSIYIASDLLAPKKES